MAASLTRRAGTLAVAVAGGGVFHWLGLPLPFLFGPMAVCLLAALAGAPLQGAGQLGIAMRTILGVAVGAAITPEVLARAPQMAGSVALIPVYVVLIGLVGVPFFRRLGFDGPTSWYAAMPGGLCRAGDPDRPCRAGRSLSGLCPRRSGGNDGAGAGGGGGSWLCHRPPPDAGRVRHPWRPGGGAVVPGRTKRVGAGQRKQLTLNKVSGLQGWFDGAAAVRFRRPTGW